MPAGKLKNLAPVLGIPHTHISHVQIPIRTREECFPNVCDAHSDQNSRFGTPQS